MRISILLLLAVLLSGVTGVSSAAEPAEAVATQLLDRLDAGDYAAAESMFTEQMAEAVPEPALQGLWNQLKSDLGAPQRRDAAQVIEQSGMQIVVQLLWFERGSLQAQIVVAPDGRVAGFRVQPGPPVPAPPPSQDAAFIEEPVEVGEGDTALPATLALPRGEGPFPGVVLVHGSGPQDRDETIGANRPFLDIARGLAAQGIAVLRYDKRTKARPQDFSDGDYTVDDETTDDAVAAAAVLAAHAKVDAQRIYVLGHSQGGMLAPRIAGSADAVAGLILMAAPARKLLDLLPEQNRYLLGLDGEISAQEQAFLDDLDQRIAHVRDAEAPADATTPMNLPLGYWRSVDAVDPVADAKASTLPMLLLQGGRDFQVTQTDWAMWQQALKGNQRVTFKAYPALNHLGIAGEGTPTITEYQQPGHVSPQLIDDIAGWIAARPQ